MRDQIKDLISKSIQVKQMILNDEVLVATIESAADDVLKAFRRGNRLLLCGNGGSASDAQHIAAEFSGRFYKDRMALAAEALHTNTSYLTAVANDYSFDEVYSRLIRGTGHKGDVLMAFSTSGNSTNIVEACKVAREKGLIVIGFTGQSGGMLKEYCHHLINIPSAITPRIQESHILVGHIICEIVEAQYFH